MNLLASDEASDPLGEQEDQIEGYPHSQQPPFQASSDFVPATENEPGDPAALTFMPIPDPQLPAPSAPAFNIPGGLGGEIEPRNPGEGKLQAPVVPGVTMYVPAPTHTPGTLEGQKKGLSSSSMSNSSQPSTAGPSQLFSSQTSADQQEEVTPKKKTVPKKAVAVVM